MKRGWQAIALTAVLAAVASGAGTWISASWVLSRREPPSLHDIVHHDLKLSPDQLTRIDAVEARFAARRPALEADVRAAATVPRSRRRWTISTSPWAPCRRRRSPTSSRCGPF